MQETNFKVGDKVKVISIPGVNIDNHPEMKGRIYTIQQKYGNQLFINDRLGFVFHAPNLQPAYKPLEIVGCLWLIVSKKSGGLSKDAQHVKKLERIYHQNMLTVKTLRLSSTNLNKEIKYVPIP